MSQIVVQAEEIFVKLCKGLLLLVVCGLFYQPEIGEREPLDGYLWIEFAPANRE